MALTEANTHTEVCEACRFWDPKDAQNGNCRRRAPQAIVFQVDQNVQFETRFPTTAAADWCGEYEKR